MSVIPAELVLVVFDSTKHPSNKHYELSNRRESVMVAFVALHDYELVSGLSVGARGSHLNGKAVLVVAVEETTVFSIHATFIQS